MIFIANFNRNNNFSKKINFGIWCNFNVDFYLIHVRMDITKYFELYFRLL